jgi:hypothetical protein
MRLQHQLPQVFLLELDKTSELCTLHFASQQPIDKHPSVWLTVWDKNINWGFVAAGTTHPCHPTYPYITL